MMEDDDVTEHHDDEMMVKEIDRPDSSGSDAAPSATVIDYEYCGLGSDPDAFVDCQLQSLQAQVTEQQELGARTHRHLQQLQGLIYTAAAQIDGDPDRRDALIARVNKALEPKKVRRFKAATRCTADLLLSLLEIDCKQTKSQWLARLRQAVDEKVEANVDSFVEWASAKKPKKDPATLVEERLKAFTEITDRLQEFDREEPIASPFGSIPDEAVQQGLAVMFVRVVDGKLEPIQLLCDQSIVLEAARCLLKLRDKEIAEMKSSMNAFSKDRDRKLRSMFRSDFKKEGKGLGMTPSEYAQYRYNEDPVLYQVA